MQWSQTTHKRNFKLMLNFFRRIRQKLIKEGNLKRYLIYSIGEIFLVVIGILIALQINNWNEGEKKQRAEKEKYSAIILDLNRDLERQMRIYNSCGFGKEMIYELSDGAFNNTLSYEKKEFNYLIYTLDYYSYVKENHKHLTGEIKNKAINDKLAQYLYYQYGVDQGLAAVNNLIKDLRAYFSANGILDLKATTSFEGAYTRDPEIQMVKTSKLLEQVNDETLQGHLALLKTLMQRVREKLIGLMTANNELQVLLANSIRETNENALGIAGSALPGGWDQFISLNQTDDYKNTWDIILELMDGEIKFRRKNDLWRYNWGLNIFQPGKLEPLGANIPVKKGRYHIQVNLNDLSYSLSKKEE
jgi:hypothetical protein